MNGKFQRSDKVVSTEVVKVVLVVHVIYIDLVGLALLEVVLHVKALDPGRAQTVPDDLCHANLHPLLAHLPVEDSHAIGPGESIQVRQILAREVQTYGLDEAARSRVNALVHGSEHGIIKVATNSSVRASMDSATVVMRAHARKIVTKCGSHFDLSYSL